MAMSDMTLGQYFPAESVIHRLDARIKIVLAIAFMVLAFLVNTLQGYGMVLGLLVVTIFAIPCAYPICLKGPKANSIYFNFYVCFKPLFNAGTDGMGTLVDLYHHKGEPAICRSDVCTFGAAGGRNFDADVDNRAAAAYRRAGIAAETAESHSLSRCMKWR